jgi:conjugal transfer pilus assembly protein TraE
MEISILANKQKTLLLQRNVLGGVSLLALIGNIILAGCIFVHERQTYIIPAHFNKEMLLSNKRLSVSYLEEMSVFYLDILLGLNEGNIGYNSSLILRHIHPSFYNQISEFLYQEQKRYKEYRLSTHFKLTNLNIDDENLVAEASGILISYFGKTGKSSDLVSYRIEYDYSAGVLTIKNFMIIKDIPEQKPNNTQENNENITDKSK